MVEIVKLVEKWVTWNKITTINSYQGERVEAEIVIQICSISTKHILNFKKDSTGHTINEHSLSVDRPNCLQLTKHL